MNIEPLRECGFMHVGLDVHELSQRANGAFSRMLEAHQRGDYVLPQVDTGEKNATPLGLTRKDRGIKNGVPQDGKYYLHIDRRGVLCRKLKSLGLLHFTEVATFVSCAEQLLEQYERKAKEVLTAFEAQYPGRFLSKFLAPNGTIPGLILRFLAYDHPDGQNKLGMLATEHSDKSGFTLTGFESGKGLEVMAPNGIWVLQPYSHGRSLAMLGKLMSELTDGEYPDVPHRVRGGKKVLTGPFARFTIVCFCDPLPNTMKIPDARATHGLA